MNTKEIHRSIMSIFDVYIEHPKHLSDRDRRKLILIAKNEILSNAILELKDKRRNSPKAFHVGLNAAISTLENIGYEFDE